MKRFLQQWLPKISLIFFFAVLSVVGITDAVLDHFGKSPPGMAREIHMQRPQVRFAEIWSGRWTVSFEEWLTNRSWLAHGSAARYREIAFQLAGRTPPTIVCGSNGRLFLAHTLEMEEISYKARVKKLVRIFQAFDRRFQATGAHLVVLLVPNPATIFPEDTPVWSQRNGRLTFLPMLTNQLQQEGVAAFDATSVLRQKAQNGAKVFFRADHHWTTRGAEATSTALADYLRKEHSEWLPLPESEPPFTLQWVTGFQGQGSVLRKFGFTDQSSTALRFGDFFENTNFKRVTNKQLATVAWAGTSFSQFHSPDFFSNAIQNDVEEFSRHSRGSTAKGSFFTTGWTLAWVESLQKPGPKLVVFEIPEFNITGAQNVGGIPFDYAFAPEPWKTSEPVTVTIDAIKGMHPLAEKFPESNLHWKIEGDNASLEFNTPEPVLGVEISLGLSSSSQKSLLFSQPGNACLQTCYDGVGLLCYRFSSKNATRHWQIGLRYVARDQICEMAPLVRVLKKAD